MPKALYANDRAMYPPTLQEEVVIGFTRHSNKHAAGISPEAQGAFTDLMTREILQFALRIAFRCVLHRCGSQDIRC